MKRPWTAVGLIALAILLGVLLKSRGAVPSKGASAEPAAGPAAADSPARASAPREGERPAAAVPSRAGKPLTDGERALAESQIPALGSLSIDRAGSPREWLSSTRGPAGAARDAELSALSPRTRAHLDDLRDRLAQTTDPAEHARLQADIQTFERNIAERRAIMSRTVTDSRRPFAERPAPR